MREAALAMVEEETRRYRPTRNYLDHLPPLNLASFESDLMKTEFERLSSRQPMDTLSMKRYELPTPPPGKMTDVQVHKHIHSSISAHIILFSGLDRMRGEQWSTTGTPENKDHEPRPDARLWGRELEAVQRGVAGHA